MHYISRHTIYIYFFLLFAISGVVLGLKPAMVMGEQYNLGNNQVNTSQDTQNLYNQYNVSAPSSGSNDAGSGINAAGLPGSIQSASSPGALVKVIYQYALGIVGLVALGAIIYGGILWVFSAGVPGNQAKAQAWIRNALLGLLLLLGAYVLFNTINPYIINIEAIDKNLGQELNQGQLPPVQSSMPSTPATSPSSPAGVDSSAFDALTYYKTQQYSNAIQADCGRTNLPDCVELTKAVMIIESSVNPEAASKDSQGNQLACGIMQVRCDQGGKVCSSGDRACIEGQIQKGVDMLNADWQKTGSLPLALATYNGGDAALRQSACCSTGYAYQCAYDCGIDNKSGNNAHVYSCDTNQVSQCKFNKGYQETRNYVDKACAYLSGRCQQNQL